MRAKNFENILLYEVFFDFINIADIAFKFEGIFIDACIDKTFWKRYVCNKTDSASLTVMVQKKI